MNFIETVQNMSAKEIILTMVEALKNPTTEIEMNSFGHVDNGLCYGCAATNLICRIAEINEQELVVNSGDVRNCFIEEKDFVNAFEQAIDYLRMGRVVQYNNYADTYEFSKIKNWDKNVKLYLDNNFREEDLQKFIDLANMQE